MDQTWIKKKSRKKDSKASNHSHKNSDSHPAKVSEKQAKMHNEK